ncbi:hypothetical protein [Hahella sp. HN01]|uniref:hypothetical protein n=1 Tax=Hahella sp. HN01 TaxID=2847262 RepID=UPI001C1EBFDF|nr:hypothetical protein [Hahella sp. HN01]MBU6951492.1 hypothetical protein [Hahella sp. HN01]
MPVHVWKNHRIEVTSKSEPKHLWLSLTIEVYVDGELKGKSLDRLKGLSETIPFSFRSDDLEYKGLLTSLVPASALLTRYSISIDGVEIEKGRVRANNWLDCYVFIGSVSLLILSIPKLLFLLKQLFA